MSKIPAKRDLPSCQGLNLARKRGQEGSEVVIVRSGPFQERTEYKTITCAYRTPREDAAHTKAIAFAEQKKWAGIERFARLARRKDCEGEIRTLKASYQAALTKLTADYRKDCRALQFQKDDLGGAAALRYELQERRGEYNDAVQALKTDTKEQIAAARSNLRSGESCTY